jgi:K+-transporting ATPase ATPase A chain
MFNLFDISQIGIYILALIGLSVPLASYIYKFVFNDSNSKFTNKIDALAQRIIGYRAGDQMDWKRYLVALLAFNGVGLIFLFLLQILQAYLPMNPRGLSNVEPFLAFNTAVSFITNTNWQSYSGEATLSYLVQFLGLTVQNFLSAATGIAVFFALSRGLRNRQSDNLGNFWHDLYKSTVYLLLPLSIVFAVFLTSQGVVQNFNDYTVAKTLSNTTQIIPQGPAASQIAIKQLGSNGGGFFGANSAFPYENPTPLSNFFETLAILLIPASLALAFGKIIGSKKQGKVIFSVMLALFIVGLCVSLYSEYSANSVFGIHGMMEGKETRFGVAGSVLWSQATTCASNGSVNAMHGSMSPISVGVEMLNMMLGEIIFGGVGAGMYGMLIFIILAVFIAGLMIGRTPEYLGKKIQATEVQMAILAIIAPSFAILVFTSIACLIPQGVSSISASGARGFSEILYAFVSGAANNGSALAGLNANTPFYNTMIALAMLIGRFAIIAPVMKIAGSMSLKKISPPSAGSFKTDTPLFGVLLIGVIIIVGALTFLPALSLGPIIEHLTYYSL